MKHTRFCTMIMGNLVFVTLFFVATVYGSRNLVQYYDGESAATASATASDSSAVASTIVSNPGDASGIASGVAEAVSSGDRAALSAIANAIVQADTQGQSFVLGDTLYKILSQQEGISYSEAESMASILNTAVAAYGCDAISQALLEMYNLAMEYNQVDNILNLLSSFSHVKECMDNMMAPGAQFRATRQCSINWSIYCDSNQKERRFVYDGNTCYSSYECRGQGYGSLRECRSNCL